MAARQRRDAGPLPAARRAAQQPGPAQRGHAQEEPPDRHHGNRGRHGRQSQPTHENYHPLSPIQPGHCISPSPTPRPGSSSKDLEPGERVYYRDRLREARYAALADAEGFGAICFALEALGLRLNGRQAVLEHYKPKLAVCTANSPVLTDLPERFPSTFKSFEAFFKTVQTARNDAMRIGAYARHATEAAIELSIGLEEALMANFERKVKDVMVKSPMTVQPWQPVAQARQLMLMHSFSFLPVRIGRSWWLVSEIGLAKFLHGGRREGSPRPTIQHAKAAGMDLVRLRETDLLQEDTTIAEVLERAKVQKGPTLWLVIDKKHPDLLAGVLSPFELM